MQNKSKGKVHPSNEEWAGSKRSAVLGVPRPQAFIEIC
jgi:hypothetical protein